MDGSVTLRSVVTLLAPHTIAASSICWSINRKADTSSKKDDVPPDMAFT
jgi:hypothetical protein